MNSNKIYLPLRMLNLIRNQLSSRQITSGEVSSMHQEWTTAKEYSALPGPTKLGLLAAFLPGGQLRNANLIEMHQILRKKYGDVYVLKGLMGKPDMLFTYNPEDFKQTYRTEGIWPMRLGLETFAYYRDKIRPDVFQGVGGLVSEQGKSWANIRNLVNPVLMKSKTVRRNLPQINGIADEFIAKMEILRDPINHTLTSHFHEELKMWAFESICSIALNKRMGLILSENPDQNALKLAKSMEIFFQLSYEFDVLPSFWKYIETPSFKRFIRTYDDITAITMNFIDEAIARFDEKQINADDEAQSVLEKLCRINKQVAIVMAMDMLMAGIDTTASVFVSALFLLAKHPAKQDILRQELKKILPTKKSPLTEENTKNMPYLRACIKEALRITPITPGNFRMTGRDLVLSGYQVPKGTGVLMGSMFVANTDTYFPRSGEFLPERWLKTGEAACPQAKTTNPFVYLPFGFGPRTCIGKRIAEMEIETLIAKIIRNYRVTWEQEEDLKYISNIILIPHGQMNFKFKPV